MAPFRQGLYWSQGSVADTLDISGKASEDVGGVEVYLLLVSTTCSDSVVFSLVSEPSVEFISTEAAIVDITSSIVVLSTSSDGMVVDREYPRVVESKSTEAVVVDKTSPLAVSSASSGGMEYPLVVRLKSPDVVFCVMSPLLVLSVSPEAVVVGKISLLAILPHSSEETEVGLKSPLAIRSLSLVVASASNVVAVTCNVVEMCRILSVEVGRVVSVDLSLIHI